MIQASSLPIWMEWLEGWIIIAGVIVATATLFVYVKEYVLHNREYIESNKRLRAESAIKMAEFFASEIIPDFSKIDEKWHVVRDGSELIKQIILIEKLNFDFDEASEIIPNKLKEKMEGIIKIRDNDPEYWDAFTKLLNKLEHFSMNFFYKISQEDNVYQSLHQGFLLIMQAFYYDICDMNKGYHAGPGKYYTYCKELYNCWNARKCEKIRCYKRQLAERQEEAKKAKRSGTTQGEPV